MIITQKYTVQNLLKTNKIIKNLLQFYFKKEEYNTPLFYKTYK